MTSAAGAQPLRPRDDHLARRRSRSARRRPRAARAPAEGVHADEVGRVARSRGRADLLGRPDLRHATVLQEHQPVGERRGLDRVVRHEHANAGEPRRAPRGSRSRTRARAPTSSAESGSSSSSSAGSATSARASATRCASPPERSRGRAPARSATPEPLEQEPGAVASLGPRHAARAERERDVLERRQVREQQQVLEHDADRPLARAGRATPLAASSSDETVEHDRALARRQQPGDRRDERRLAGAVRPEEGDRLAGLGLERGADRRTPRARRATSTRRLIGGTGPGARGSRRARGR